jgi:hypothetical protein
MANENTQAEVGSDARLGPLPERFDVVTRGTAQVPVWTAEQLRAYAAECVAAERERCADLVSRLAAPPSDGLWWAGWNAAIKKAEDMLREVGDQTQGVER